MIEFHPAFDRCWYLEVTGRTLEAKTLRELTEKVTKRLGNNDFHFVGYHPKGYGVIRFPGSVISDAMRTGRIDPRAKYYTAKIAKRNAR